MSKSPKSSSKSSILSVYFSANEGVKESSPSYTNKDILAPSTLQHSYSSEEIPYCGQIFIPESAQCIEESQQSIANEILLKSDDDEISDDEIIPPSLEAGCYGSKLYSVQQIFWRIF